MGLTLIEPPCDSLGFLRFSEHSRIPDGDHTSWGYADAAYRYVEDITGRQLQTATWAMTLSRFPSEIVVPKPPLQSVTSVTYIDTGGQTRTLDTDQYIVLTDREPARIVPSHNASWPTTQSAPNAVTVTFIAGYPDEQVPGDLRQAIRMLAAHWYESREAVTFAGQPSTVPMGFEMLLWKYRVFEIAG